jgi:hypothetical protein
MLYRCSSRTVSRLVVVVAAILMTAAISMPAESMSGSAAAKGDLPIPLYCLGVDIGSKSAECGRVRSEDLSELSTVVEARTGNTSVLWRVDSNDVSDGATTPLR